MLKLAKRSRQHLRRNALPLSLQTLGNNTEVKSTVDISIKIFQHLRDASFMRSKCLG